MLFEDCTEVLYVYKSSLHGNIQDAIALLQILGSLLQTDESHEVLRSLPCQSLQLAIKERTAHRHLPAKAVDGEAGVAQVIENETGCFLNESLVLWIQESLVLWIQNSLLFFLIRSLDSFYRFISSIQIHHLFG